MTKYRIKCLHEFGRVWSMGLVLGPTEYYRTCKVCNKVKLFYITPPHPLIKLITPFDFY